MISTLLWVGWILGFFAIEIPAVLNSRKGDTFSEKIRLWYRTGTTPGRWAFIVSLGVLFAWFGPHILK